MFTRKESISVPKKSKSLYDKSRFNKFMPNISKANLKQIQDALILLLIVFWNSNSISILRFKIYGDCLVL